MDRSPEKSASITVTIQPSRLADGEFFSSLLEHAPSTSGLPPIAYICRAEWNVRFGPKQTQVG
jgi:hypothetical protein